MRGGGAARYSGGCPVPGATGAARGGGGRALAGSGVHGPGSAGAPRGAVPGAGREAVVTGAGPFPVAVVHRRSSGAVDRLPRPGWSPVPPGSRCPVQPVGRCSRQTGPGHPGWFRLCRRSLHRGGRVWGGLGSARHRHRAPSAGRYRRDRGAGGRAGAWGLHLPGWVGHRGPSLFTLACPCWVGEMLLPTPVGTGVPLGALG